MAILKRHRHVKRYSQRTVFEAELGTGASGPADGPLFSHFSVRMFENAQGESYTLELTREECEQMVNNLRRYLERDSRKPFLVNGSKGHA